MGTFIRDASVRVLNYLGMSYARGLLNFSDLSWSSQCDEEKTIVSIFH